MVDNDKRYGCHNTAAAVVLISSLLIGYSGSTIAQARVDSALPAYERTAGVAGNLNSIGSDTLNNLMTLWAEAFRAIYPNVNIQIEGKGRYWLFGHCRSH